MDEPHEPPQPLPPPGRVQKGPFVTCCNPGKYAWCRCQRSQSFPYCDGTHRGTPATPLKVVFDATTTVIWCACACTKTPPFCDGSHARLV
ncbi:MAG: CDGSH iron-sulfur domain-containing protein [Planctomycetes bacterium]|nr:CDGSH iron-sulfur domain-containing protein [Planctomycetota bacterium]